MPLTDGIAIAFTAHEWRLLAIAAACVKPSKYIHQHDRDAVKELADRILQHTKGKP